MKQNTLEVIIQELRRQHDESRAFGLGWLDVGNPREATLDGQVDLVALANAIDRAREIQIEPIPPDPEFILGKRTIGGRVCMDAEGIDFTKTYNFKSENKNTTVFWKDIRPTREGDKAVFVLPEQEIK